MKKCPKCKGIREDVLEKCFVDAYELLCRNDTEVIAQFMKKIKSFTMVLAVLLLSLCVFTGVRQAFYARPAAFAQTASQEDKQPAEDVNEAVLIADIAIGVSACVATSVAIVFAYRRYKQC